MKPRPIVTANHDSMLNLGCNQGVCFWNTNEAKIVKRKRKSGRPSIKHGKQFMLV